MEYKLLGYRFRVELVILIVIIGTFIVFNMWCSCAGGVREGFEAGRQLGGAAIDYVMGEGIKGSWTGSSAHLVQSGTGGDAGDGSGEGSSWFSHLDAHPAAPHGIPLPEGHLSFFNDNKFAPECCPSAYSSSTGCVCASPEQMKYLSQRGGNRTSNTEF